ncbi:MAG: SPFH domain-containing protein [Candidatus Binatia bacterium]
MPLRDERGDLPPVRATSDARAAALIGQFLQSPLVRRVVLPLVVLVLGIKVLMWMCLTYVGPNQYGIKVVRVALFGEAGVQPTVYDTGFHFVLKPLDLERMFLFPKDLQIIDLTGTREEAAREANIGRAAHIQTSDGFYVDVDVSIIYHIKDPYLVFTRLGPDRLFESNGIQPKAEPVLKQTLGELTTEEFYISPLRHARAEQARDFLNRDLAAYGLEVDQVLVRYFRYTDEIQKNIEEKKLKDQLVFKNQAEGRAATEGAKLAKVIQEGRAAVDIKLQEGDAYQVTKQAERDRYVRTKRAEGDLLVKLAEAQKTQLRNDALQVSGADRMVGLKLAEALQGVEVLVLPSDGAAGVNPLDLRKTLQLFDVGNAPRAGN